MAKAVSKLVAGLTLIVALLVPAAADAECPEGYSDETCERFGAQLDELCELASSYDGNPEAPGDQLILLLRSWLSQPVSEELHHLLMAIGSGGLAPDMRWRMAQDAAEYMDYGDFACPALQSLLSSMGPRVEGIEAYALGSDPCARARLIDSPRLWRELLDAQPELACAEEARARIGGQGTGEGARQP